MSSLRQPWIGYGHDGERVTLEIGGQGSKVLILGAKAGDLAAIAALSAKEAGWSPVVLDLDGFLASHISGHIDTYDYHSFLRLIQAGRTRGLALAARRGSLCCGSGPLGGGGGHH